MERRLSSLSNRWGPRPRAIRHVRRFRKTQKERNGGGMARNRFVNTNPSTRETVKVELSDGDYVLFKKELTNRELRHSNMAAFGALKGDFKPGNASELGIDWENWEPERVFTWLHGWSFVDAAGAP